MPIINKIENIASINYNGTQIDSLAAETLLLVLPTILKTVDKAIASIGDTLTYTITVANIGLTTINDLPFSDAIPAGSTYVDGSFRVNGSLVTPTLSGETLDYTIPSIPALGIATLQFQVQVVGGTI